MIAIPVSTPLSLSDRRVKLTIDVPDGVHPQLGPRTFLRATAFAGQP